MKRNLDLPVIWDHAWIQLDCLSIFGALSRPVGHSSVSLIFFPITFDSEIEPCSLPKQLSLVCSQWYQRHYLVLKRPAWLHDGNFQKNLVSPHLPLPSGAREALSQKEGQDGEGEKSVRSGWPPELLALFWIPAPLSCLPKIPLPEAHTAFCK